MSRLDTSALSTRPTERGQVIVMFAGGIVLFMLLLAVVLDVSWYWANTLRVQRAADAAALAGAVYLPGARTTAYSAARAEAQKNGYTDPTNATVTPIQDSQDLTSTTHNPRQLNVTVSADVGTFFMRVIGISTIRATRSSKAEYVLPVPMGSPQNYYGVGFFQGVVPAKTDTYNWSTDWLRPFAVPDGGWTTPAYAYVADETPTVRYATRVTNTANDSSTMQAYGDFRISIPAGATVTGIEVRMQAYSSDTSGCRIRVALNSANVAVNDASWTSVTHEVDLGASPPETTVPATLGGAADTWGRSWSKAQVESTNFRVRVQARDPGSSCTDGATAFLDLLEVNVYSTTTVTTSEVPNKLLAVPNPTGGNLATQGFWGAIFTSGGIRENGDRYAPLYIGGNSPPDGTNGGPNPDYDPNGYDYTIEVGTGGQVQLFDPIFCATGASPSGGWYGTGDHWTNDGTVTTPASDRGPVAARYRLYNTEGTPYTTSDDTQVGADLTYDPGTFTLGDFSGNFNRAASPPQNSGDANRKDCSTDPAHNKWVLPSGWSGLAAGTYRLNVNTNLGQNAKWGAENLFSIWVSGGAKARVYGGGRMAAYTNLDETGGGGAQTFYFAQIEAMHAGKTMVITLFDPGEANANSYLRFLSPQGGTYHYATFDWSSNDGRSGTSVQEIQTSNGTPFFNNRILTIEIPLPSDYGVGGLDPNGLGEDGWWRVEYDVRAANDTTTWEVEIRGNPVHLKVP
jgi:hypothetical protein